MTPKIKKQIESMHAAGVPAKAIATALGLEIADVQSVVEPMIDAPDDDSEVEVGVDDSVVQAALNRGPTQFGSAKIYGNCATISARGRRML